MKEVKEFLNQKQSQQHFSAEWANLQQLYEKRLWHELTNELMNLLQNESFRKIGGLQEMYSNFLSNFEHRINPLSLAEMLLIIGQEIEDPEAKISFFEGARERVKNDAEARILLLTAIGNVNLSCNKLEETKKVIKDAYACLDTLDGVTTVHGRFYDLSSNYSKIIGSFNEYYRDALRYLGCMELSDLPALDLQQRAFNLSIAALLGNEVYNFGELLAHDVLKYLKKTEHEWLIDLLFAFNSGDIDKFKSFGVHWRSQPDLVANEHSLLQKITLLSLMELAFERPSTERNIPFSVIAERARLQVTEVELLVMKALSLGLIKGSIDEVEKSVNISWVQPRVLDLNQINNMKNLVGTWGEKVKTSAHMVEDQVPELLVKS